MDAGNPCPCRSHLSAAPYLQEKLGGKIGIGDQITVVQDTFGKIFNEGTEFQRDGSQFDRLFEEGDSFHIGQMRGDVLHTPGHTPACLTYVIGDAAFVGDTLFMPDFGTARCDFPGGSVEALYASIQKILALPDATRIFRGSRLQGTGPGRLCLGDDGGRAEGEERPCRRRHDRGRSSPGCAPRGTRRCRCHG
jgi:glyoxylase-like metal-dependent hydrolase (beta-lactamase superfamily II)